MARRRSALGSRLINNPLDMEYGTRVALKVVTEEGEEVEMIPESFKPLEYEHIINSNSRIPIEISAKPGTIIINGEKKKEKYVVNANILFSKKICVYILEEGGWLPIACLNNPNIIPDRNIIITLKKIKNGSQDRKILDRDWWLSFYKNSRLTINPILYAFEGKYKKFPTINEFISELKDASKEIVTYFPNSHIITYQDLDILKLVYSFLREISDKNKSEEKFIVECAKYIHKIPADNELSDIQDAIDDIAIEHHLFRESIVYYMVISCLYDRKHGSQFMPARKIIKPKPKYTNQDAYNAISDINALAFYIQSLSYPKIKIPICTCDKYLAAFWALLNPFGRKVENGKITISFPISKELVPRLSDTERVSLGHKLTKKL